MKSFARIDNIFSRVIERDPTDTIKYFELCKYSVHDLEELRDMYKNTLLHVCVMTKNHIVLNYLLDISFNSNIENRFSQTALDLAISNKDNISIQSIINKTNEAVHTLKTINKSLISDNDKLSVDLAQLKNNIADMSARNVLTHNDNVKLTVDNKSLKRELTTTKKSNKRLLEEYDNLDRENKKLKTSVTTMLKKNVK